MVVGSRLEDGSMTARRPRRLRRRRTCRIRSAACPAWASLTSSARSTRCASGSIRTSSRTTQLTPGRCARRDPARRMRRSPPGSSAQLPAVPGQRLNATITAQSRLQTPEQFEAILLRGDADWRASCACATSRASSSAAKATTRIARFNGKPATGMAIQLATGRQRARNRRRGQAQGRGARELVSAGRARRSSRTTPRRSSGSRSRKS